MAESERLRGNRSPVTNYKVGDGSVKDLFKYIMGEDLDVKKIRSKRKQTKVAKKDKEFVRKKITSGVKAASEESIREGIETEYTQPESFGDIGTNIYGPQGGLSTGDTSMYGAAVEPPGRVNVTDLPPEVSAPPNLDPDRELEAMLERDQGNALDSGQTYRMGMNRPNTPMENPAGTFGGELLRPQGMGQEMYGGGRVMQKKKKKKKKLAGGGKVRSYNY